METRLARIDDAEAIRQIYNREVSTSTVTFDLVPRTLDEQITWLQARSGAHVVRTHGSTEAIELDRGTGTAERIWSADTGTRWLSSGDYDALFRE